MYLSFQLSEGAPSTTRKRLFSRLYILKMSSSALLKTPNCKINLAFEIPRDASPQHSYISKYNYWTLID